MAKLSALEALFPTRELDIHRLCARDAEFRSVCEDYELAVSARQHWKCVEKNAAREAEDSELAAEIADEIAVRLDEVAAILVPVQGNRSG